MQIFVLNNYMNLSTKSPEDIFAKGLKLKQYSCGIGYQDYLGFIITIQINKSKIYKNESISGDSEKQSASQFFYIFNSVDQQRGYYDFGDKQYEIAIYTSCCNTDKGIYYYTTYDNHQIIVIDMNKENLDEND